MVVVVVVVIFLRINIIVISFPSSNARASIGIEAAAVKMVVCSQNEAVKHYYYINTQKNHDDDDHDDHDDQRLFGKLILIALIYRLGVGLCRIFCPFLIWTHRLEDMRSTNFFFFQFFFFRKNT